MDNAAMIETIDGFLKELGTTGLVDAKKARDQLMDLRLMCMLDMEKLTSIAVAESLDSIE